VLLLLLLVLVLVLRFVLAMTSVIDSADA